VYEGVKRHRPPRRGDVADPGRHAGPVALDAETAKTIFETLRRRVGGHVLDCRISSGRVRYQICQDWMVKPDSSDRFDSAELTRDRSREIRRVETARDRDGDQPHLP
jgi:hypothetical protein